jgi:hypothetical protein
MNGRSLMIAQSIARQNQLFCMKFIISYLAVICCRITLTTADSNTNLTNCLICPNFKLVGIYLFTNLRC